MRSVATDIADFPFLERVGKVYADKMVYMHRLIRDANSRCFISYGK